MEDELQARFDDALAGAVAGRLEPDSVDLDGDTIAPLQKVVAAFPDPATNLVRAARDEFDELLADVRSVEQSTGNTIPAAQLRYELGIDEWLDQLDPDPTEATDATHMRRIAAAARELNAAVSAARVAGDSWAVIAVGLGVSADEARRRYDR